MTVVVYDFSSKALYTLSQKSATVLSQKSETVAEFGDSRTFLRQCGQNLTKLYLNH